MRYHKSKRKISGLLACAVICSTAAMPQAQVIANQDEETVASVYEKTTDSALEIVPGNGTQVTTSQILKLDIDSLPNSSFTDNKQAGDFTIIATSAKNVSVEENSQTADDGTIFSKRIKLNGTGSKEYRAVRFTTTAEATLDLYAMSGSSGKERTLVLCSEDDTVKMEIPASGVRPERQEIALSQAGTYYLYSSNSGINIYDMEVTVGEKQEAPERAAWDTVAAPVITQVKCDENNASVVRVEFELETSRDGADKALVEMRDSKGEVVASELVGKTADSHKVIEFTPSVSDNYQFVVYGQRYQQEDEGKASEPFEFEFNLPLASPNVTVSNKGEGNVLVKWTGVKEAEQYRVDYQLKDSEEVNKGQVISADAGEFEAEIKGLEIGKEYTFYVSAIRADEVKRSEGVDLKIKKQAEREWAFTYFGQSSSSAVNTYEVVNQEDLTIKLNSCSVNADGSINKKGGKFTTYHDGISYYYTEVDPEKENFVLRADFKVDYINPTPDGQEGFGIIAMDSLGEYGVNMTNHYTNSASVLATKFTDSNGVSYKDTLGSRFVSGITPEVLNGGDSAIAQSGKSVSTPLSNELIKQGESYTLTLKKTNTGYHAIINDDEDNEHILYNGDKLLQLDGDKVYVGFAVARGCNVTVSNITMDITDPATDPEGIPEPEEFAELSTKVDSPSFTGDEDYNLVFTANVAGKVTVNDAAGNVLTDGEAMQAGTDFTKELALSAGKNDFEITFTPDEDARTSDGLRISSYDPVTIKHSVTLQAFEGSEIYVSPQGSSSGAGTEDSPVDIYTASKFVKAGQTIVLAGGTYSMTSPLVIARGVNGTESAPISLRCDEAERAVFDFTNASAGMQVWGNYWHIYGIDVCNTPGNVKGLQVAGHNNIIELVNAYNNGDTGIQISGTGAEGFDKWPSNNLILNCTSYDNCDPGENNADGFAAKLTCGNGNVFRGCAAYNNIDDGWDLFSKIESGPIGAVTVEDCITFKNGTLSNGHGNGDGNGFKLGGDGISVPHVLRNSISFNNNTNGITSNSDPAVQLYNNTAYGNKGGNISLYGKGTGSRDFVAENNISMAAGSADNYSEMPSLASENNYFFNGEKSVNSLGKVLTDEIFDNVDIENYVLSRNADGSINMGSLLRLNDKAPAGIGARLEGEAVKPVTERSWNFGDADFTQEAIQGKTVTIQDIVIDAEAEGAKFNAAGRSNAQINPGTVLKIPVAGPTEITFKHGYDAGTMTFTDEAGHVITHEYSASGWATETVVMDEAAAGYITVEWQPGSKFYIESLAVKEAATKGMTIEVGPNRTYTSVQEALNAIDYTPTEKTRVTLALDPGVYEEEVTVTLPYVTFKNANPDAGEVKITYDKASGHDSDINKNFGTQQSASVTIAASATGFEAYDVTFENSYNLNQPSLGDDSNARKQTQAVAVVTLADQIIFNNCKFIGRQDTLFLKGASVGQTSPDVNEARVYLKDCYIEGTVDFIFGDATAVFEDCQLHMAYYTNGGHYTAANTNLGSLGYVFNNCELTIDEEYAPYIDEATGEFKIDEKTGKPVKNIDLGRPWQADHTYPYFGSQSVFINCKMDKAIKAEGWSAWDVNTVTNKVRYMEYNSMDLNGNPVDLSKRLDWVRILDADQAAAYRTGNVLRGSDNWNPSGAELGEVSVADITLDQYKVELPQGESTTLTAKVLPAEGTNQEFTWTSSNEAVVQVDENGKVTAIGAGTANVTAVTAENGCKVSAVITVVAPRTQVPEVKEIKIEAPETILPGTTLTGTYSYALESDNVNDNAKVQWFVVDPVTGDEILVQEGTEDFDRTYKVIPGDIGYQIKFAVIPETTTTYGNTGDVVKSEATAVVVKPAYAVPELYVREPFTSFMSKYEQVGNFNQDSDKEWLGANVAKGGIADRTALTLLQTGAKEESGKDAWKIVDTSGKTASAEDYNGNATISSNIEYQNDASILMYNAKENWTNYTANARVRFSPLATGFSAASYWDMYICYNPETNSGYKVRLSRGGNTSSAVFTLYKVVEGMETAVAADDSTLANGLKQNAAEENPFFRVQMSNNAGEITAQLYFEGTDEKSVTLSFKDETPLSGTVAFETFGKSGCPLVDMLTVEEILTENNNQPSAPDHNDSSSDDDDDSSSNNNNNNNSSNGGGNSAPSEVKEESAVMDLIENALNKSEVPVLKADTNHALSLSVEHVAALVKARSDLRIQMSDKMEVVLKAAALQEQAEHALKVKAADAEKVLAAQIDELVSEDDKVTSIEVTPVTLSITSDSSKEVASFTEPVQVEWAVAKEAVKNVNSLTAVRYEVQADGLLKAVRIGGTYNAETGKYTFLTDKSGTFGLVEASDLIKVTLKAGSRQAVVNGSTVTNDVAPEITDDRTMVPIRFIAESLGAKVGWKSGRVTITLDDQTISFKVGETLSGYDVTPYVKENRTYISTRWVAEQLGAHVLWVPSTQAVEIVK